MSQNIPATLLAEQIPTIRSMAMGGAWSVVPARLKSGLQKTDKLYTDSAKAASDKLVEHYAAWSGAPADRYIENLPPHFFSKWGMPLMARLTALVPYNLLSVLNQGCRIRIHADIPRGQRLQLQGRLMDCTESNGRVRIHTRITAGTASNPESMTVDGYAAVVTGKSKKTTDKRREPAYETVGAWSAGKYEGLRFFYLTGDFNPIHTFWPLARRTRFGGCILHGFGNLARTYEAIENAGYHIRDIDVRFIKPHLLPSNDVQVQVSKNKQNNGRHALRLIGQDGSVYMAGSFADEVGPENI